MILPSPVGIDSGPYAYAAAVTPSDTVPLANPSRGIYVGGAGNLSVVMISGDGAVFSAVSTGAVLPIAVDQVNATGTTATNIVALW